LYSGLGPMRQALSVADAAEAPTGG